MKDFTRRLDEIQRREFLAGIAKASLGVTILPSLIDAETAPGGHVKPKNPKAKNVIFVYMDGGMSHLDTFDPKTNSESRAFQPHQDQRPGASGIQAPAEYCKTRR